MIFGKAFKTRRYNVFNYQPRYYDERKERIQKLEEKYAKLRENGSEIDTEESIQSVDFSRNNLRKAWKKQKSPISDSKSTLRLALIITILVGIAVYTFDLLTVF